MLHFTFVCISLFTEKRIPYSVISDLTSGFNCTIESKVSGMTAHSKHSSTTHHATIMTSTTAPTTSRGSSSMQRAGPKSMQRGRRGQRGEERLRSQGLVWLAAPVRGKRQCTPARSRWKLATSLCPATTTRCGRFGWTIMIWERKGRAWLWSWCGYLAITAVSALAMCFLWWSFVWIHIL